MNILKLYRAYSFIVSITAYITMFTIWLSSTANGLFAGHYFVTVETDVIGENWIEILILLTALPGVLYFSLQALRNQSTRPPQSRQSIEVLQESTHRN